MLDRIVADTRRRLEQLFPQEEQLRRAAATAPPVRPVIPALQPSEGLAVIAEIKRRSPSRGELAAVLDPAAQAAGYVAGGAAALSVLTEPYHFAGSADDLAVARAAVEVPVLRKDFTLHPLQVWEARAMGADLVLAIAAILDDATVAEVMAAAAEAGVEVLVEVHDAAEAERAVAAGARMVGVNNRDLTSFEVDLATAEKLAPLLEGVEVRVAESGIFTAADARRMADAGYQAVLVGEALVRAADPAGLVGELSLRP